LGKDLRSKFVILYVIGMLLQQTLAFVISVVSARVLGPEAYGITTLLRNVFQTLFILAPLGLDIALLKYVPQNEEKMNYVLSQVQILRFIVLAANGAVILLCLLWGGGLLEKNVYHYHNFAGMLTLTLVGLPFAADMSVLYAVYRSRNAQAPSVFAMFYVAPIARLALFLALLFWNFGIYAVIYSNTLSYVIGSVFLFVHFRSTIRKWLDHAAFKIAMTGKALRDITQLFGMSLWLVTSLFLYGMFRLADVLVLAAHVPAKMVGEYGTISVMSQLIQVFPAAFSQNLAPDIARNYHNNNIAGVQQAINRYIRITVICSSYIFAGIAVFGSSLDIIFGEKYNFDPVVVFILPLGYLISATMGPTGYSLSMTGRHREESFIVFFGGILLVALCLTLVPMFGQLGAACAVAIGFLIINSIRVVYVSRVMHFIPGKAYYVLSALVAAACALAAKLAAYEALHRTLSGLLVGCVIYSIAYWCIVFLFLLDHGERRKLLMGVWN
jgi:O-antigen/teichoic acid export membrane protein